MPVPGDSLESSHPLSAEAVVKLKSLEDMFRTGVMSKEAFIDTRARLYASMVPSEPTGVQGNQGVQRPVGVMSGGVAPGPSRPIMVGGGWSFSFSV